MPPARGRLPGAECPSKTANFPVPQPLSVVLFPGEVQPTLTLTAGFAPQLPVRTDFGVQILQVIPRRLDRIVRMEVQIARSFTDATQTRWSFDELR